MRNWKDTAISTDQLDAAINGLANIEGALDKMSELSISSEHGATAHNHGAPNFFRDLVNNRRAGAKLER